VRDPAERRELLRPDAAAAGRHLHLLIPGEEPTRLLQVVDLRQALLQLSVGLVHAAQPIAPALPPCRPGA
jgi:hypothetical protein